MTFAVESGALKASPAARRSAPPSERHELQIASEQQVAELAEAVGSDYAVLIYAAAYTGLWAGELAALRVRDLDFMRSRIHVRQAVAEVHGELIYGQPTSGKTRTVSLPSFLRDMLTAHIAEYATESDALVFWSPSGGPLRHGNFYRRHFRPAADSIGLDGFRFHDLRPYVRNVPDRIRGAPTGSDGTPRASLGRGHPGRLRASVAGAGRCPHR